MPNPELTSPPQAWRAEVVPPSRPWERKAGAGRIRGAGWFFGEKLSSTLADEILTPGEGQVRALVVDGANPAALLPDKPKVTRAFNALELLVAIEPTMTETARLAHYVLPPKLAYERPDMTFSFPGLAYYADGWTQYTPAVMAPPAGAEVVDDWFVFWSIARRLGLPLGYAGQPLDMNEPPTSEALIPLGLKGSLVPFEAIAARPAGYVLPADAVPVVEPARPEAAGRFDVAPADIAGELAEVAGEDFVALQGGHSHRLVARRMRHLSNTVGLDLVSIRGKTPHNPAFMHPDDLAALGVASGARVHITSDHGTVVGLAQADATMRPGTVALSHGWGTPDSADDPARVGTSSNFLIADDRHIEPINAMVRMTAIPVTVQAAG